MVERGGQPGRLGRVRDRGVASYVVPETGDVLALAAANFTTVIGALCFLAGAVLLLVGGPPRPQRPAFNGAGLPARLSRRIGRAP